jgi:hypothetical protein
VFVFLSFGVGFFYLLGGWVGFLSGRLVMDGQTDGWMDEWVAFMKKREDTLCAHCLFLFVLFFSVQVPRGYRDVLQIPHLGTLHYSGQFPLLLVAAYIIHIPHTHTLSSLFTYLPTLHVKTKKAMLRTRKKRMEIWSFTTFGLTVLGQRWVPGLEVNNTPFVKRVLIWSSSSFRLGGPFGISIVR